MFFRWVINLDGPEKENDIKSNLLIWGWKNKVYFIVTPQMWGN